MQGYCMKCKAKREIRNGKEVEAKNHRMMLRGKCQICGTTVCRALGKKKTVSNPPEEIDADTADVIEIPETVEIDVSHSSPNPFEDSQTEHFEEWKAKQNIVGEHHDGEPRPNPVSPAEAPNECPKCKSPNNTFQYEDIEEEGDWWGCRSCGYEWIPGEDSVRDNGLASEIDIISQSYNIPHEEILNRFTEEQNEHPKLGSREILRIVEDHIIKEKSGKANPAPSDKWTSKCYSCGEEIHGNDRCWNCGVIQNPGGGPLDKHISNIISIVSVKKAKASIKKLHNEFRDASMEKKKRIIDHARVAMNKAKEMSKSRSAAKSRAIKKAVANVYSKFISKHGRYRHGRNNPPEIKPNGFFSSEDAIMKDKKERKARENGHMSNEDSIPKDKEEEKLSKAWEAFSNLSNEMGFEYACDMYDVPQHWDEGEIQDEFARRVGK